MNRIYRGADKSLTRPTSRCIFFMVRIFCLMLVFIYIYIYIYIYSTNIAPIIIINRMSNIQEPTRCNNNLLIYKIRSTYFGQFFAHLQERKTEIFTAYGILLW